MNKIESVWLVPSHCSDNFNLSIREKAMVGDLHERIPFRALEHERKINYIFNELSREDLFLLANTILKMHLEL